jgi:hypothetical protein
MLPETEGSIPLIAGEPLDAGQWVIINRQDGRVYGVSDDAVDGMTFRAYAAGEEVTICFELDGIDLRNTDTKVRIFKT